MYTKSCFAEQNEKKTIPKVNIIFFKSKSALPLSTVHLSSENISTFPVAISASLYSFNFLFTDVPHAWTLANQLNWHAFPLKFLIPLVLVCVWLFHSLGHWLLIVSTMTT